MAVGIIQRFLEGVGAAEYDTTNEKLDPASNTPDGLIFHCAGELDGRFQVFDVWDTRESFDRFVEQRLIPVQKEVMGEEAFAQFPGLEIVETDVHNYFAPWSRRPSSGIDAAGSAGGVGLSRATHHEAANGS